MTPLNAQQLTDLVDWMREQVLGAQLQGVSSDGEMVYLELFGKGEFRFLIDLRPGSPFFVLLKDKNLPSFKKKPKPVSLFLNSHAKNLFLKELDVDPARGRVVRMRFSHHNVEKECFVEIVLIPRIVNMIVTAGGKSVAWNKPRELPETQSLTSEEAQGFGWPQWTEDYLAWRFAKRSLKPLLKPVVSQWSRDIEKKKSAIGKIQSSLSSEEEKRWRAFGDILKTVKEPPLEYADLWEAKLSLKDNRERAFKKAKDLAKKREGAQERITILMREIGELERRMADPQAAESQVPAVGTQLLQKTDSRGRSLKLPSGAQAVIGKSAKDNLALLRQARAWDFWIHLKDDPSAHALIFRNKGQNIPHAEIETVASWMLQQSMKKKIALEGLKFAVVVVECRFVRPIKGDRLGRVTYHSPSTFTITFKDASKSL